MDVRTTSMPVRWILSACALCSNGCALDLGVAGNRIVGVRGRPLDRSNRGRLGPKGIYGWAANSSADRLTHPQNPRAWAVSSGELGRGDVPDCIAPARDDRSLHRGCDWHLQQRSADAGRVLYAGRHSIRAHEGRRHLPEVRRRPPDHAMTGCRTSCPELVNASLLRPREQVAGSAAFAGIPSLSPAPEDCRGEGR